MPRPKPGERSGHPTLSFQSQRQPGIYTKKEKVHDKCQTESFNNIGDPYIDVFKRIPVSSRFKGTQMKTNPPKNPSGGVGAFDKFTYSVGGSKDSEVYLKSQPLDQRKLGFGSKDAFKCGEFTNVKGSAILTEKIHTEMRRQVRDVDSLDEEVAKVSPRRAAKHLYDIGRNNITEFDPKSSSDKYYNAIECKSRIRADRNNGSYIVASQKVGAGTKGLDHSTCKPKHGHIKATKQFFDKSHLGEANLS